ncbi:hypothetical protein E4U41_007763 [Claviceps citrina]|nr:hypothetical protein E4U41_007763 [Claviceps citrina]
MVTTRSKSASATPHDVAPSGKQSRRKRGSASAAPTTGKKSKGSKDSKTGPTVLEKGILYFFVRARVDTDGPPEAISDVARSYLVLHPLSRAGHPEEEEEKKEAPLPASARSRLIALPKKVLPASAKDRFLAFVEKADASLEDLREGLLRGEDYETKTAGRRHRPGAVAVGEGVYVLSWTGRESHLSYVVTVVPGQMGGLRRALRLGDRGSFIISSRNPGFEAPGGARLPEGPDFPKSVLDKFNNLRWAPTQPEFMDYPKAQILLIGDQTGFGKEVEGVGDGEDGDGREGEGEGDGDGEAMDALGVLNQLESEDVERMRHLSGEEADAIYEDLRSSRAVENR